MYQNRNMYAVLRDAVDLERLYICPLWHSARKSARHIMSVWSARRASGVSTVSFAPLIHWMRVARICEQKPGHSSLPKWCNWYVA